VPERRGTHPFCARTLLATLGPSWVPSRPRGRHACPPPLQLVDATAACFLPPPHPPRPVPTNSLCHTTRASSLAAGIRASSPLDYPDGRRWRQRCVAAAAGVTMGRSSRQQRRPDRAVGHGRAVSDPSRAADDARVDAPDDTDALDLHAEPPALADAAGRSDDQTGAAVASGSPAGGPAPADSRGYFAAAVGGRGSAANNSAGGGGGGGSRHGGGMLPHLASYGERYDNVLAAMQVSTAYKELLHDRDSVGVGKVNDDAGAAATPTAAAALQTRVPGSALVDHAEAAGVAAYDAASALWRQKPTNMAAEDKVKQKEDEAAGLPKNHPKFKKARLGRRAISNRRTDFANKAKRTAYTKALTQAVLALDFVEPVAAAPLPPLVDSTRGDGVAAAADATPAATTTTAAATTAGGPDAPRRGGAAPSAAAPRSPPVYMRDSPDGDTAVTGRGLVGGTPWVPSPLPYPSPDCFSPGTREQLAAAADAVALDSGGAADGGHDVCAWCGSLLGAAAAVPAAAAVGVDARHGGGDDANGSGGAWGGAPSNDSALGAPDHDLLDAAPTGDVFQAGTAPRADAGNEGPALPLPALPLPTDVALDGVAPAWGGHWNGDAAAADAAAADTAADLLFHDDFE